MKRKIWSTLLNPLPWLILFAATVPFAKNIPRTLLPYIRFIAVIIAVLALVSIVRVLLRTAKKPAHLVFVTIILMVMYLLFEGLCWVGGRYIIDRSKSRFTTTNFWISPEHRASLKAFMDGKSAFVKLDAELGWDFIPGGSLTEKLAITGEQVTSKINQQCVRSDAPTGEYPPQGKGRIFAIGDSFAFGSEVDNGKEWVALANSRSSRFDYVNLGVGGYGPVQATLRYKRYSKVLKGGNYVLVCLMPENVRRALAVTRMFLEPDGDGLCGMPYAELDESGKLRIVPNAFPTVESYSEMLENTSTVLAPLAQKDYHLRQSSSIRC